ncbi:MAG: class I SAM-dependent methyltransferase [Ferruginibacter sp.]
MRTPDIKRLSSIAVPKNAVDYIVMYFLIRDLKNAIGSYAKGKILDVGCGNKPYEPLFNTSKENYVGCDVVQSSENKVDVLCKATCIHLENEMFDTVLSTQVMEHVDNSDLMMKECNRVLKQNGILILSVPLCWELHEEPYDFFRFTKYGLQELCIRNNFEVVELMSNGGKWAAIFQMNINMIYSTFRKKNLFIKGLKFLFINLHFTSLLNRLAIRIDKKYFDPLLTLNYVLVARKK